MGLQVVNKVPSSFSGSTEESGTGGPAHLECCWDNQLDVIGGVVGELGKDIAEFQFFVLWNTHAPKAVFDIKFAKENGSLIGVSIGKQNDEATNHISKFGHGLVWGCGFIGEFVDGFGVGIALAFGGEVKDHSKEPAFVRNGCNGTDFGVFVMADKNQFAKVLP